MNLDGAAFRAKPRLLVDEAWKVLAVVEEGDQPHGRKIQSKGRIGRHVSSEPQMASCPQMASLSDCQAAVSSPCAIW